MISHIGHPQKARITQANAHCAGPSRAVVSVHIPDVTPLGRATGLAPAYCIHVKQHNKDLQDRYDCPVEEL